MNKLFSEELIEDLFNDALISIEEVQGVESPYSNDDSSTWFQVISSEKIVGIPNIIQANYALQEVGASIQFVMVSNDNEHLKILIEYSGEPEEI